MSVEQSIEDALSGHLKDLVFSPVIPVEWPRMEFNKPASGQWLRPTLLRGGPSMVALPNNSRGLYPGIYQVDVLERIGIEGDEAITATAAAIAAHFARGLSLYKDEYTVRIMAPPSLLPIQPEAELVMLPVRITWQTYARNA